MRGIAQGDSRPTCEVGRVGGTVAGEVPAGEACQRVGPVERFRCVTEPVGDSDERVLRAAHRPADHLAAERRRQEHVHECLSGGGHAGGVEAFPELGARLWPVRHRLGDDVDTALGLRVH